MGKIALLVPREEMLYLAHNILQEKKYSIGDMRVIQTENAVMEADVADGTVVALQIRRDIVPLKGGMYDVSRKYRNSLQPQLHRL